MLADARISPHPAVAFQNLEPMAVFQISQREKAEYGEIGVYLGWYILLSRPRPSSPAAARRLRMRSSIVFAYLLILR